MTAVDDPDDASVEDGAPTTMRPDRWWAVVAYGYIAFVATSGFIVQTGTFFRGPDWGGLAAFHDGPSWDPVEGSLSLTSGVVFGPVSSVAEWTFWPYRVVAVAAFALALIAVYRFASRAAGPAIGAIAAALLASFTHAAPLLTQPFATRFPLSVAIVIALAHLLDRGARSGEGTAVGRRNPTAHDLATAALFSAALATSIVGLAAIPLVATSLVAQRARWPRWSLLLTPVALWLAWFTWRGSLDTEPWNWTSRGQYAANLVGRSFQHLACNSATLAAVVAAGVIAVLWTDPERRLSATWRPVRWLTAAGVFTVVTTYRNGSVWLRPLGGDPPDTHSWVLAAFVVLAVVESVRHRHLFLPDNWRQAGVGALGVAIALSSVTLAHAVEATRENVPEGHGLDVDTLAAVESLDRLPDDSWTISIDFGDVSARQYQDVVEHLGSPLAYFGVTPDDAPEALRTRDRIVVEGLGLAAEPGDCQWTSAPADSLEIDGAGRAIVASLDSNAPTDVYIARLAEPSFRAEPFAAVDPGQTAVITLPDPGDGNSWSLWVEGFALLGTCVD